MQDQSEKVISIEQLRHDRLRRDPGYQTGMAKCVMCHHTYEQTAKRGILQFDCPECSRPTAFWYVPTHVGEGEIFYKCTYCSNDVFVITQTHFLCTCCGVMHTPEEFF
jgi:DNA-directed RNA polymerase subunit RPC12/RpoP